MTVSMSAVWDRTSEFLSDNLAAVAGIAALTIFVPTAVIETLAPMKEPGAAGVMLGLAALSLVLGIVSLWGQLAIMALALDPAAAAGAGRARATRRLGPMILVALAILAVLFVLALPILGTLIASNVDLMRFGQAGAQVDLSPGAGAFVALYFLLVFVPFFLFLLARLAVLSAPVVMSEHQALGALGRAFRLSRGLTWRIIGVLLLYLIVTFVAALAAKTVFGSLFALLVKSNSPISTATVLTALVSALVTTIFSVIGTVFPAKLYLAVRDREGKAAG